MLSQLTQIGVDSAAPVLSTRSTAASTSQPSVSSSSSSSSSSTSSSARLSNKSFSATPTTNTTSLLSQLRRSWLSPSLDVESLQFVLDHDNHDMRQRLKDFMNQPLFVPRYNISIAEERQLAYARLAAVCQHPHPFFSVQDFRDNPHRIYAAHEMLGYADGGQRL
jgi:hypothetical protein